MNEKEKEELIKILIEKLISLGYIFHFKKYNEGPIGYVSNLIIIEYDISFDDIIIRLKNILNNHKEHNSIIFKWMKENHQNSLWNN